jgi:DMSO reductase anchor subunit
MESSWTLISFTLLIGLGMGVFFLVALSEWLGKYERFRLPGTVIALVAMVAGGSTSFFHVGHPERIANVLANFDSRITQELILIVITGVLVALYGLSLITGFLPELGRKILTGIALVFAVILASWGGYIYVLPARPAWNTILWPLLFIASASILGLFTAYTWAALTRQDGAYIETTNKAAVILLAAQAVLVIIYLIFLATSEFPHETRHPLRLLAGDLALIFWAGVVLLGLAIPMALTLYRWISRQKGLAPMGIALMGLASTLVGAVAIRHLMYMLGTSIEQFL